MSLTWEQRWHPLRREWVLYTSHRGGRPWIGDTHSPPEESPPPYDPTCALCPGNKRVQGENPNYPGVYWFTNDLPPFGNNAPAPIGGNGIYQTRPVTGTAEVVCYSPNHAKTFVDLSDDEVRAFQAIDKQPKARQCNLTLRLFDAIDRLDAKDKAIIFRGMMSQV